MSGYLDRYARRRSVCHRLPDGLKVLLTFALIGAALVTPLEHWPLLGLESLVAFSGLSLAGVPLAYLRRRLALFIPMMVLLTISLPAAQGFRGGWELQGTIVARSTIALLALLWLVNVLPFDELLVALRRWKFPPVLLATLSFTYRFLFVMWDEMERMQRARKVRSFGRGGLGFRWATRSRMLGMLLIRGLTRAERVYGAMCARGWNGRVVHLEDDPRES